MIDIHSHILYGVDDGAASQKTTIEMLNIAVEEGIKSIIATPHFIIGSNMYNNEGLLQRYKEVCELIRENDIPIELYLGNELFGDALLADSLESGIGFTLANSKYVLTEFSYNTPSHTINNILYNVFLKGYTPVIAHPERVFKKEDKTLIIDLIHKGCFLQMNTGSITGLYGKTVKRLAYDLLESNMIHIMATDAHTSGKRSPRVKEAYNIISTRYGNERAEKLFITNGTHIINNTDIDYVEPTIKAGFITRIRRRRVNG